MLDPLSTSAYRQLPPDAVELLRRVAAPPRLIAHLVLVHDVASKLVECIAEIFPELTFDRNAVVFGASIHDFGKAVDISELFQGGKEHEKRGVGLLKELGIPEERARFAYTHGNWDIAPNIAIEDLLVALADNCWKGKRVDELEARTVRLLSSTTGKPAWTCYAELDEIIGSLAQDAYARLAWQGSF